MTLQGTFFNDEKNDVSFLAGTRQIVLMEHQSTLNENMPLRMFWYMAKLYRKQVPKDAPYRTRRIRLPAPCFYVFDNGLDPAPDEWEMRLSEAFEGEPTSLELCVKAYNINEIPGSRILERSRTLKGYSMFVVYCTQGCGHAERRDGVKPWQSTVPMKMIPGKANPFSCTDPEAGNCRCV